MSANEKKVEKAPGRFSKARRIVLTAVFLAVVVGLIVRGGWGTLSSLGIDAVAYLCPLGALETLLAAHTMVPRAIISLVVVLTIVALVGRAFCSWVCPVPPIMRFFHPKKEKQTSLSAEDEEDIRNQADELVASTCAHECASCGLEKVGGNRDGFQVDSRHAVLLGALVSSAVCGFPVFCLICPIGLTFALAICVFRAFAEQSPTLSLLVFALILLAELVFFRKWCRKICPLGALMSLVGARAQVVRPHVDASKCLRSQGHDCRVCVKACPEEVDPHSASISECTRCGECAEKCPTGAITLVRRVSAQKQDAGKLLER